MKPLFVLPALLLLALAGCSSSGLPGSARYFSNQPDGPAFFRVTSGLGNPALAVRTPDGKWTKAHEMEPIGPNDPPLSTTPGLAALVKSGHRVDDYAFLEFKPGATANGHPVPSRYFLFPGGFAYPVSPGAR